MRVYTCKDNFEDMMCCIYDAWDNARAYGHDNIRLMRQPVLQESLFEEYIEIEYDEEKVQKVIRSIQQKISQEALMQVYYASLSQEEDALDAIYRFLRVGFRMGGSVTRMYSEPCVMRMFELRRQVGNEVHHFREFVRFVSMGNMVYVAHIEPKNNIAFLVGRHFEDRMPSENWMIIDDKRHLAVVHGKDEESYIRILSEEEYDRLSVTETYEDEYTGMWKTFFAATAIAQRENPVCQRNLFPIWLRRHVTEFL